MKRPIFLLSGAGVVTLAAILLLTGRRLPHDDGGAVHAAATPIQVETTTAAMADMGQAFEVGGTVRARETATIVSRIIAQVREVRVKPGDRVRAGQVLATLDGRDLSAGRARAKAGVAAAEQSAHLASAERQASHAALSLAAATHRRIANLRQKNSATASELDAAEAALRAAEARLQAAEAQVAQAAAGIEVARASADGAAIAESYATLTAPFSGVITQKLIDAGNMASPGVALLTVEDARAFRLEVRVDESRAALVTLNQQVDVLLDGVDSPRVSARVSEMSRVLDPGAHAFLAKLELPAVAGLRSGLFGRARFAGPRRSALGVPESSVVRRGQLTSVFVVDTGNLARLRLVTAGEAADGRIEVRAGLDPGETVVVNPPQTLVDGSPVKRVPTAAPAKATLVPENRI